MYTSLPTRSSVEQVQAEKSPPVATPISKPEPPKARNFKVLIIEDERALSKAMYLKLTKEGYKADAAYDGEEGLKKIKEQKYDLVILDLVMPKVDGFEVMKSLKEVANQVPIVVISNLSQGEDIQKVKDLGAKDYFIKSDTQLSEIIEYIKENFG